MDGGEDDEESESKIQPELAGDGPIDDSPVYDCTGQHNKYPPHPFLCERFIQCHNGRTADHPCPSCEVDANSCPNGRLCLDLDTW